MILCKTLIKSSELIRDFCSLDVPLKNCRYDFEYEDDDEDDAGDVGIENKYYNAKQMKADNPDDAIQEFLGMPALEDEKGDWSVPMKFVLRFVIDTDIYDPRGFKGLKQAVKLEYKLGKFDKVRSSMILSKPNTHPNPGYRALYRASYLRQVCCDPQLLREVHKQHARLHREGCGRRESIPLHGKVLLPDFGIFPEHEQRKIMAED